MINVSAGMIIKLKCTEIWSFPLGSTRDEVGEDLLYFVFFGDVYMHLSMNVVREGARHAPLTLYEHMCYNSIVATGHHVDATMCVVAAVKFQNMPRPRRRSPQTLECWVRFVLNSLRLSSHLRR